eukprot:3554379-Prymnesium_polylepis.2
MRFARPSRWPLDAAAQHQLNGLAMARVLPEWPPTRAGTPLAPRGGGAALPHQRQAGAGLRPSLQRDARRAPHGAAGAVESARHPPRDSNPTIRRTRQH